MRSFLIAVMSTGICSTLSSARHASDVLAGCLTLRDSSSSSHVDTIPLLSLPRAVSHTGINEVALQLAVSFIVLGYAIFAPLAFLLSNLLHGEEAVTETEESVIGIQETLKDGEDDVKEEELMNLLPFHTPLGVTFNSFIDSCSPLASPYCEYLLDSGSIVIASSSDPAIVTFVMKRVRPGGLACTTKYMRPSHDSISFTNHQSIMENFCLQINGAYKSLSIDFSDVGTFASLSHGIGLPLYLALTTELCERSKVDAPLEMEEIVVCITWWLAGKCVPGRVLTLSGLIPHQHWLSLKEAVPVIPSRR